MKQEVAPAQEDKVYVISMALWPGKYSLDDSPTEKKYSKEGRSVVGKYRGTAAVRLDFRLNSKEDYEKAMQIIGNDESGEMVNGLFARLRFSYTFLNGKEERIKLEGINIYEEYIDYNSRENFRVEVKK